MIYGNNTHKDGVKIMKKFTITAAKTAGFCFGVDRAVKLVYNEIEHGFKTATLGEIIHNPTVVNDLAAKGVRVIDSPADALAGEKVVIRSHGVGADVYRELEARHIPYADGTCPFVKRIQKIAAKCSREGKTVVIMGDSTHPEVIGIAAHCENGAVILPDDRELEAFLKKNYKNSKKKVAIMPQTTYNISMWQNCVHIAAAFENTETYDTICSATSERQAEAARLAADSDIMIVVGGKHSSNTVKLFRICSGLCGTCFHIESPGELSLLKMPKGFSNKSDIRIGITAGASTPASIIKEVKNQMSEIIKNMDEDFNFEEALNASFKRLYTGNRVKGYITAVNNTEAIVDVGTKHTGYVALDDLTDDSTKKPGDIVSVGDEIDLIVIKVNDAEGTVALSKRKVDEQAGYENILKAKEEGTVLEGVVQHVVNKGVTLTVQGVRVFIPASLTGLPRGAELEQLLKQKVEFIVIEVTEGRKRAVGSIKAVQNAKKAEAQAKFWETAKVGDVFTGKVKSLTSFGAFVDLGGIDGMVHISELSWKRIKHPSEVVSVGDTLEVYIKDLDREANRISLGFKKAEDNPWEIFKANYKVGDVVKATIVSITNFGAFAQIIDGVDGLIHISQIADRKVENVKDVLSVGDVVDVKIIDIDTESKRISISIRALLEDQADDDAAEDDAE